MARLHRILACALLAVTVVLAAPPVRILIAPVIPGLNDSEIPAILQAAKEAGAHSAFSVLQRARH